MTPKARYRKTLECKVVPGGTNVPSEMANSEYRYFHYWKRVEREEKYDQLYNSENKTKISFRKVKQKLFESYRKCES